MHCIITYPLYVYAQHSDRLGGEKEGASVVIWIK